MDGKDSKRAKEQREIGAAEKEGKSEKETALGGRGSCRPHQPCEKLDLDACLVWGGDEQWRGMSNTHLKP